MAALTRFLNTLDKSVNNVVRVTSVGADIGHITSWFFFVR